MTRRALSPSAKVRVLDRQDRRCAICQQSLDDLKRIEFDHHLALCFGGTNDESNFRALCRACHLSKTKLDVKGHAKSKRIADKLAGKRKRRGPKIQSRPFPSKEQRRELRERYGIKQGSNV